MWWKKIWLITVVVVTASADHYRVVNTIEDDPLKMDQDIVSRENHSTSLDLGISQTTNETIRTTGNTNIIKDVEKTLKQDTTTTSNELGVEDDLQTPDCTDNNDEDSCDNAVNDTECEDEENGCTDEGNDNDDGSNGDNGDDGSNGDNGDDNGPDSNDNEGSKDLIVKTKSGYVQGFYWQDNENITSYIDIPYGVIDNIFQLATPMSSWEIVHAVKRHNKRCPQLQDGNYIGDINCLTLSIFRPMNIKNASVLFHIHADNFNKVSGDPSIYGPEHLVVNGIILVLPNYRLGPLGFLCMQNETAPGNMALKDLSLALSWIYNNIEVFGGDPDNIAVSGDGKSGALAGLLALSPMSKGYVSKVITESGSVLSYWALDRNPSNTAEELFKRISEIAETQSRTDISMRDLTTEVIVKAAKDIKFRPCLEKDNNTAFMVETPYDMMIKAKIEKISFLIGSAMYAGIHEALLQTKDSVQKLNEDFTLLLPEDLIFGTTALRTQAGERVKTQYFGEKNISLDDMRNLTLCFTDIGYLGPGIRLARLLTEAGATVYFYEFAFVGEMNRVLESIDRPVDGAVRGDIIGYLFTQNGVMPTEQQTRERKMIKTLTQMWTSFLETGIPSTESIEWKELKDKDYLKEEWLLIDLKLKMKNGIYPDRLSLWTEIYEKHYIDGNHAHELSPSVYTVLILQIIFWLGFCRTVSHVY